MVEETRGGREQEDSPQEPEARPLEGLRVLLVPVDLTPISDRVLGRVSLLPLAEAARVVLLHVVPDDLPARAQGRAERDAEAALANEARHLASALPQCVSIELVVKIGAVGPAIVACVSAVGAELVVMGRGGGRALGDLFLGSTAERVIRHGRLPVLAVRLAPRSTYSRPAVALNLDHTAADVLALLLRIVSPPRPRVVAIHAVDTAYRGLVHAGVSDEEVAEWHAELEQAATEQMANLFAASLARANVRPEDAPLCVPRVQSGSARRVIAKAAREVSADLLVLGTHGYSGIAHLVLGTVAGDVLRSVACDVLVVPGPR